MQRLQSNFCDYMKKESEQQQEKLFDCLKIYYNTIIALEYLKKIGLMIENFNLNDIFINQGNNGENQQGLPCC